MTIYPNIGSIEGKIYFYETTSKKYDKYSFTSNIIFDVMKGFFFFTFNGRNLCYDLKSEKFIEKEWDNIIYYETYYADTFCYIENFSLNSLVLDNLNKIILNFKLIINHENEVYFVNGLLKDPGISNKDSIYTKSHIGLTVYPLIAN